MRSAFAGAGSVKSNGVGLSLLIFCYARNDTDFASASPMQISGRFSSSNLSEQDVDARPTELFTIVDVGKALSRGR